MLARRVALLTGALVAAAACGAATSSEQPTTTQSLSVGQLPSTLPTVLRSTTSTEAPTTTTTILTVGHLVTGNRVIAIGDSIFASAARRLGGELCDTMVPLGWAIEVDAEPARRIQFGNEVLDVRLRVEWDAAVVMLGNNYVSQNPEWFRSQLKLILDRLSPRPIVLFTVTYSSEKKIAVNEMIREAAVGRDNVWILDWAAYTTAHPEVLRSDGLHITEEGRQVLADELARVLGTAPTQPGECLGTDFFDDSGQPPAD